MASEQEYQTKTNSLHSNGNAKNERAFGINIIQEMNGQTLGWTDGRVDERLGPGVRGRDRYW